MSTQTQLRQPSGIPAGGQFAAAQRPGADLELASVDGSAEYLAALSPEDRKLAEAILDPATDLPGYAEANGQTQFEYLESFGGYYDGAPENEAAEIAARLAVRNPDVSVRFSRDRSNGEWEWSATVYLAQGLNISTSYDLELATTDPEATGMDAALAYAKAITRETEQLQAQRDKVAGRRLVARTDLRAHVKSEN